MVRAGHSPEWFRYAIEHYSNSDGLSQSLVSGITQDQQGYLWISTKDGLNRFDGYRFKVYRHNKDNPNSISNNHIHKMFSDPQNRIWLLMATGGIDLFNPANEKVEHLRYNKGEPNGLPEDAIGNLLCCYNGSALAWYYNGRMPDIITPDTTSVNRFRITPLDKIYPGIQQLNPKHFIENEFRICRKGYLWRKHGDTLSYYHPHSVKQLRSEEGIIALIARDWAFATTQTGETFIYQNFNKTLYRFNEATNRLEVAGLLPLPVSRPNHTYIDRNQMFWAWVNKGEIIRMNTLSGKTEIVELLWNHVSEYAKYHGGFTFLDQNNNMWLESSGYGLYKINSNINIFKILQEEPTSFWRPSWPYRTETTGSHALYDPKIFENWKLIRQRINFHKLNIRSEMMGHHFTTDHTGEYWMTFDLPNTGENGLARASQRTALVDFVKKKQVKKTNLYGAPMFCDSNNHMWCGVYLTDGKIPLYEYTVNGQETTHWFPVRSSGNPNRFISDWIFLPGGRMILGTTQGVFIYSPSDRKWKHYTHVPGNASSLTTEVVLSLCLDPKAPETFVWVGTEGGGLNKLNLNNGHCMHITEKDGLPNNVIYGILADRHQNLWLSTNNGLCLFNPENRAMSYFTEKDGLPGNEFNRYEYSATKDGLFYFGGIAGSCFFDPESFYSQKSRSKLVVNKVMIEGHHKQKGKSNYFQKNQSPEQNAPIILAPGENILSIHFALLNLTSTSQNYYYYQMNGYQDGWSSLGHKNEITFTNLSPGTYRLEIRATENRFSPIYATTGLLLIVQPNWYQTTWFKGLLLLAFAGMLYSLYRYRLSQVLAIEKLRNQISRDLHDEMGSTLSSIALYGAAIQNTEKNISEKSSGYLDKIIHNTSGMMEAMNDIVWSLSSTNNNNEFLINRMKAFAMELTEPAGIQLEFRSDYEKSSKKLKPEHYKNIFLLFKEIIHNSVKHSRCKCIRVKILFEPERFILNVSDNGIGFISNQDSGKFTMGGHGIPGIKKRAEIIHAALDISSSSGLGTTVSLTLNLK